MSTIKEDYCSKEIYRLLREKGFDGEVHTTFDKEGYTQPSITLQMAMKWLREVHNLHIEVRYFPTPNIYRYVILRSPMTIDNIDSHPQYFNSYEEACEAAIKYCLDLI